MAIKWEDVRVDVTMLTNDIVLGKVKSKAGDLSVWTDRSEPKTEEVLNAVIKYYYEQAKRDKKRKVGMVMRLADGDIEAVLALDIRRPIRREELKSFIDKPIFDDLDRTWHILDGIEEEDDDIMLRTTAGDGLDFDEDRFYHIESRLGGEK